MNIFERKTVFNDITAEIQRAESKHPKWPIDLIHGTAVVAEEMGEAVREANLIVLENKNDVDDLRKELIETCATAVRMIVSIDNKNYIIKQSNT